MRRKISVESKNYGVSTFCYDLILEILGEYPTDLADNEEDEKLLLDHTLVLKIVVAEEDIYHRKAFDFKEQDLKKFYKYFRQDSRYTVLDINIARIPIRMALDEGDISGDAGEMEAQTR